MNTTFRPSVREMTNLRKSYLESCKLSGRGCVMTIPTGVKREEASTTDVYTYDHDVTFTQYIQLSEDLSKRKIESYGWWKESDEAKPIVAFIPFYRYPTQLELDEDEDLTRWSKIEFRGVVEGTLIMLDTRTEFGEGRDDVLYMIEDIIYKDDQHFYVARVAPHRVSTDGPDNCTPSGGSFLIQTDEVRTR